MHRVSVAVSRGAPRLRWGLCLVAAACTTDPGSLGSSSVSGESSDSVAGESVGEVESDATGDSEASESSEASTGGPACGDGQVDDGEECDDGNDIPGDGCEADCVETTILEVHAGGAQTCILLEGGALKCWGDGASSGYGHWQNLGDDEFLTTVPIVPIGEPVAQVATGGFTCVLLETSKAVKCWGRNLEGQSGLGPDADEFAIGDDPEETPDQLPAIDLGGPVSRIAVGNMHACAVLEDGSVRCWGSGDRGATGQGHEEDIGDDELPSSVPPVQLGVAAKDIYAGVTHSCAVTVDDDLICWGANYSGQLGYGHTDDIGDDELPSSAGLVPLGGKVMALSVGWSHACARLDTEPLLCWGGDTGNALGPNTNESIGDDEPASAGVSVSFSGPIVGIPQLGAFFGCALREDGVVQCWGDNQDGQLGLGHVVSVEDPLAHAGVQIGLDAVDISVGNDHVCAILEDNQLICWGDGDSGRLGQGNSEANIGDNEVPEDWGPIDLW